MFDNFEDIQHSTNDAKFGYSIVSLHRKKQDENHDIDNDWLSKQRHF